MGSVEGGLGVEGHETKSIRDGGAKLQGAYVVLQGGELWLLGAHISPYIKAGAIKEYDPDRRRKVLVSRKELLYLAGKVQEKGLTLVAFSLYSKARRIKLGFALCRGKKAHDKRDQLKQRDVARTTARFLRGQDE
mgnify:CR=1 FL=1